MERSNRRRGFSAISTCPQLGARKKHQWRKAALAAAAFAVPGIFAQVASAQISVNSSGAATQNFDTIGTAATASLPTNWRVDKNDTVVRTVGAFSLAGTQTTQAGSVNISTSATNGIYNLGPTGGSTERAVGFLSSGGATKTGNLYGFFQATETLTSLTLSYDVEKYRQGSNAAGFSMQMYYSLDGTTWTDAGGSFKTSFAGDGSNAGYTPAPGVTQSVTAQTLSLGLTAGTNFYLAWNYSVTSGTTTSNAQLLSIDNISVLGVAGAATNNLAWNTTSGTWDQVSGNKPWLNTTSSLASSFTNGDLVTLGNIASDSTITVAGGGVLPGSTAISNAANTYTFTGGSIGGGAITKTNNGSVILASANTFGGLNINGGSVETQVNGAGGNGTIAVGAGTWKITTNNQTVANVVTVGDVASTINTTTDLVVTNGITGAGGLTKAGAGTMTLNAGLGIGGNLSITGGTLNLSQAAGGTITINANSSANNWTGNLEIQNANQRVNFQSGVISGGGEIRLKANGIGLTNTGSGTTAVINNPIVLNYGDAVTPTSTYYGNIGSVSGASITIGGVISGNGNLNFAGGVSGLSGNPANGGAGTVLLNAVATYTGDTHMNFAQNGKLIIGVDNALPSGTNLLFGTNNGAGPGNIDLNGHALTVGALSSQNGAYGTFSGKITNEGTSDAVFTISGSTSPSTGFSGVISDGAVSTKKISIVKGGSNTLVLNAVNTYTGTTTVNGGNLVIASNGSISTGAVAVNSTATLSGRGTVGGNVTVTSGTVSPGTSTVPSSTFTLNGGLSLASGGTYNWDLNDDAGNGTGALSTTTNFDQLVVGGSLVLGGTSAVNVSFNNAAQNDPNGGNSFWVASRTWKIIDSTGTETGALPSLTAGSYAGGSFSLTMGTGGSLGDVFLNWNSTSPTKSLTWDGNGNTSPDPSDVSGTWNAASSNWFDGTGLVAFNNSNPDIANFGAGNGNAGITTVTVASTVTAGEVNFNSNSNNYLLTGGTIHLNGTTLNGITAAQNAEIASALVFDSARRVAVNGSAVGLTFSGVVSGSPITKTGSGVLLLTNSSNTFTDLTIKQGSVQAGSEGALGTGTTYFDGGTLTATGDFNIVSHAFSATSTGGINTNGFNVTMGGVISGGGTFAKTGVGTLVLTNSNGPTAWDIQGPNSVVAIDNGSQLGGGTVALGNNGGTLRVGNSVAFSNPIAIISGGNGAHIEVNGSDVVNYGGLVTGGALLNKDGTGTLIFTNSGNTETPRSGTTAVNGGTLRIANSYPDNHYQSPLGNGVVQVNNGGTLEVANIQLGDANSNLGGQFVVKSGGTMIGTGTASIIRMDSPLIRFEINAANPIYLGTGSSSSDSITIGNSIRNESANTSPNSTVLHVIGAGTVRLASGPTSVSTAADHFNGTWSIDSGVLQVGPPAASGTTLNALGYKYGANAVGTGPDGGANLVTLNGGTIAFADDLVPGVFKNPITFNSGTLTNTFGAQSSFSGAISVGASGTGTISLADLQDPGSFPSRDIFLLNTQFMPGSFSWGANSNLTVQGGGTLHFNRSATAPQPGTVTVGSNAAITVAEGATISLEGTQDSLAATGGGAWVNIINNASTSHSVGGVDAVSGTQNVGIISGTGATSVETGATLIATAYRGDTLVVHGTAQVRPNGTSAATSKLNVIATDAGKSLDLTNNKLVIPAAGNINGTSGTGAWNGTSYTGLTQLIKTSRNGGAWSGPGIITSQTAAATASQLTNLAIASASDVKGISGGQTASFFGQTVSPTDTVIMYTYNGDATMDGKIDADDYFQIDSHYNKTANSEKKWFNGDFNYDGKINGDDYALIDAAYSARNSYGPFNNAPGAGGDGGLAGVSAVPEPASFGLLGLAATGLLGRRRRRN